MCKSDEWHPVGYERRIIQFRSGYWRRRWSWMSKKARSKLRYGLLYQRVLWRAADLPAVEGDK